MEAPPEIAAPPQAAPGATAPPAPQLRADMSSEQLGEYLLAFELKDGSKPFAAFADNTEHFTLLELLT